MIPEWAKEMNCAITVCDKEGVILYMNDKAKETFSKHGNLIGKSLIPCHNERSRGIIADLWIIVMTADGTKKIFFSTIMGSEFSRKTA